MKCRLLCLHGRYQTGSIFQEKMRHAYQAWDQIEANYECVFVDAPHRTKPKVLRGERWAGARAKQSSAAGRTYREWWPDARSKSAGFSPSSASSTDTNMIGTHADGSASLTTSVPSERVVAPDVFERNETAILEVIAATLRNWHDGDGSGGSSHAMALMGFSQGAAAASYLCTERARKQLLREYGLSWHPQFAVLLSGYNPSAILPFDECSNGRGDAHSVEPYVDFNPSLRGSVHIYGKKDKVVLPKRSRALASVFGAGKNSNVLELAHDYGHVPPPAKTSDAVLAELGKFITRVASV